MNKQGNENNEEGKDMAELVKELGRISEINYLLNKIQSMKLNIVEEIGKIVMAEKRAKMDPNLIMESLMIEYYTQSTPKYEQLAEESIVLAYEAERVLKKHID